MSDRKFVVHLSPRAAEMLAELEDTTGTHGSQLFERAVRHLYEHDDLHRLVVKKRAPAPPPPAPSSPFDRARVPEVSGSLSGLAPLKKVKAAR